MEWCLLTRLQNVAYADDPLEYAAYASGYHDGFHNREMGDARDMYLAYPNAYSKGYNEGVYDRIV